MEHPHVIRLHFVHDKLILMNNVPRVRDVNFCRIIFIVCTVCFFGGMVCNCGEGTMYLKHFHCFDKRLKI
jgi:hypothetical protein